MRTSFVSLMAAIAAALIVAAPAVASYGARSAPLLWERVTWNDDSGRQSTAILNGGGTLTVDALGIPIASTISSCDNASGDQLCFFGRPTVSPDGARVVVSRHPLSGLFSGFGAGTLELLDSSGANPQTLRQLTASDTQPAFLAGGGRLVFTGRRTLKAPSQLYEVNVDGSGLRQLTFRGGSWAAPCANGAIVFDRGADLWLIPAHGNHWTRLVRGGSQPDCAPNSRQVVYAGRGGSRLALIGLNGRGGKLLPHGSGTNEAADRPGHLSSPAFSPDGKSIAYLRTYDDLSQDGESYELDIADVGAPKVSGRILTQHDIADEVGGSYGADNDQSASQYVSW